MAMEFYQRYCTIEDYSKGILILAPGYYKSLGEGEDEYSKKSIYFTRGYKVYKGYNVYEYFKNIFEEIYDTLFANSTLNFDYICVIPSHEKGIINQHLIRLASDVFGSHGVHYYDPIEKYESNPKFHGRMSMQEREMHLSNTIRINKDVDGKNIILFDNVTITGMSMIKCKDLLLQVGANKVMGISLGLSEYQMSPRHNFSDNKIESEKNISEIYRE